ncbi:MAG: capsule assembly Wzi family protein [Ignavibacteriaceae bacterium]|nr:capsule assembly Wzi family protein [Ignavibacteriaceae bacterium]
MIKKIILISIAITFTFIGQVNYEPVNKGVYEYLNRLSVEGFLTLHDEIKPFTRIYIASKLKELLDKREEGLSLLEKEELRFYIRDFAVELGRLGKNMKKYEATSDFLFFDHFGVDKYGKYNLFEWEDSQFSLVVNPILGHSYSHIASSALSHRWNGATIHGSIGGSVAFDLIFLDNLETGKTVDLTRRFTKKTGYTFLKLNSATSLEYDEVNANVTVSNTWGSITVGKDFNYYGDGMNGNLILGDKAPSFPQIKIEVSPVDWFKFSYMHGWLNSQVIDSSTIRINTSGGETFLHVPKYIAAHMFSFTLTKNINLSIGESVIYSDRFQPIYLIPVMFFRLADHYLTVPDNAAGNAQIYSSFWYKIPQFKTKFYGDLFIDELSLEKSSNPQAIGYTIGVETINPLIKESEVVFEYTKIEPFVYFHRDDAQFYSNYNYQLGHWIGSNGDQLFASFKKRILRGFDVKLAFTYVRKGSAESKTAPRYLKSDTFLHGLRKTYKDLSIEAKYELIHDLIGKVYYQYSYVTDEDVTRTPAWQLGVNHSFGVSLQYGI